MKTVKIHGPNNMWTVKTNAPRAILNDFMAGRMFSVTVTEVDPWGESKKHVTFNPALIVAVEIID